jgi:hypothetical protein
MYSWGVPQLLHTPAIASSHPLTIFGAALTTAVDKSWLINYLCGWILSCISSQKYEFHISVTIGLCFSRYADTEKMRWKDRSASLWLAIGAPSRVISLQEPHGRPNRISRSVACRQLQKTSISLLKFSGGEIFYSILYKILQWHAGRRAF